MKKTLFALVALAGIVHADETPAYLTKYDDFTQSSDGTISLDDVATTFNAENGSFAVSFDWAATLEATGGDLDFKLTLIGESSSYVISFAYMEANGMTFLFPGSTLGGTHQLLMAPITADVLIFQVNNLLAESPSVTLSAYNEGSPLAEIWSGSLQSAPFDKITSSEVRLTNNGGGSIAQVEDVSMSTWQGKVTADDMANPTPAPAPSPTVPEPATATLSLLALAGLAARRRRH